MFYGRVPEGLRSLGEQAYRTVKRIFDSLFLQTGLIHCLGPHVVDVFSQWWLHDLVLLAIQGCCAGASQRAMSIRSLSHSV